MPFHVTADEIAALDPGKFVDFMGHLLQSEREQLGMPPGSVIAPASLVMTVSDGGVDAIAEGSPAGSSSWLTEAGSVWQFKAADITPRKVKDELNKQDVEDKLRSGKRCCLAMGVGLSPKMRRNREQAAEEWFRDKGLPPNLAILDATQLANWAERYPSVAMLPFFSGPQAGGLFRLDDPATFRDHEIAYSADQHREDAISQIRSWLEQPRSPEPVRVEGPAGVGKTRLVLEALRGSGWEERALYCPVSAYSHPEDVLNWVTGRAGARLALVVDECDGHRASLLSR